MLHSLHHPCVVSLLGISIHPLCFALQLAPLGSLNTVLEEKQRDKGAWMYLVFDLKPAPVRSESVLCSQAAATCLSATC